jgi:hypothetical protein
MARVIIVVDLGHFRAYRVTKSAMESPKVELIESYDTLEAHGRLGDKLTDKAGRFGMGGEQGNLKGYGEPHNLELESMRRVTKQIARDINAVIQSEDLPKWYLAAGKRINNQILDNLDPSVKGKLWKNLKAVLTKVHKSELLDRFE